MLPPVEPPVIETARTRLVPLDRAALTAMAGGRADDRFSWPPWWPDEPDRSHVERWLAQAMAGEPVPEGWGPRAILVDNGPGGDAGAIARLRMVGHVGFHRPPVEVAVALSDPTYRGEVVPATGGAVEIGYSVFGPERGQGYATEAAGALIAWAIAGGEVSTVLATVAVDNAASIAVLDRLGGFVEIGACTDDGGTRELVYRFDVES